MSTLALRLVSTKGHALRMRRSACRATDFVAIVSRPRFFTVIVADNFAAIIIVTTDDNRQLFTNSIVHAFSPPFSSRFCCRDWMPDRASSPWSWRLLVIAANCIGEQPGLVAVVPILAVLFAVEPPVQDSGRGRLAFVAPVESFAIRLFVHLSHPLSGGFCVHRTAPDRFVFFPTRLSLCRATGADWQNRRCAGSVENSEILRRTLRRGLSKRRYPAN